MAIYTLTNNDVIKGGHLMVFLNNTPIAFATSHSFSKTLNTQQVSTKDHGDTAAVLPQNITWELTTENLYSLVGYETLNTLFNAMAEVDVYFGETTYSQHTSQESIVEANPAKQNWSKEGFGESGKAYITSLQVTAAAGDNSTFSATFTGNGSLSSETPTYNVYLDADPETSLHMSVAPTTVRPEVLVQVIPNGADYYDNRVTVTTTPATNVQWNNGGTFWQFPMPYSDVTVHTRLKAPYTITKQTTDPEYWTIDKQSAYMGETVTITGLTPNEGGRVATEPYTTVGWDSTNSYYYFEMPDSNVTVICYVDN